MDRHSLSGLDDAWQEAVPVSKIDGCVNNARGLVSNVIYILHRARLSPLRLDVWKSDDRSLWALLPD